MSKWVLKIVVVLFVALSAGGCGDSTPQYFALEGAMLGTTYHIKAQIDTRQVARLRGKITALDQRLKRELSIFDPTSRLSQINRNESDILTPWLEFNILLADSISRLSDGVYDITVAPLVEAWGFARPEAAIESPNIDSLLEFVGYQGISINEGRISKRDPRMKIDLNSIAKGFAVDKIAETIASLGSENYIVEVGGEIRLAGTNPQGESWRVGVETPIDGNMSEGELLQRRIVMDGTSPLRAMATSGNYRRFHLDTEGRKVVHTIDPTTGLARPSSLLSVTVLAPTCAEADAYATMFMAAGELRAEELAKRIENCEVYFIYNNARAREEAERPSGNDTPQYREYISEGMRNRLLDI